MNALLGYALDETKKAGIPGASAILSSSDTDELTLFMGAPEFARAFSCDTLSLYAYGENKSAFTATDDLSKEGVIYAVKELAVKLGGTDDDPYDPLYPTPLRKEFIYGPDGADMGLLQKRMGEVFDYVSSIDKGGEMKAQMCCDFLDQKTMYLSTLGAYYFDRRGFYSLSSRFTAKRDKSSTNANGFSASFYTLDRPFLEHYNLKMLIDSVLPQLEQKPLTGKFVGDMIISPLVCTYFARYLGGYLGDKSGPFKGCLEKEIVSPIFSVHIANAGGVLPHSMSFTTDGAEATDMTAVKNGVLKEYIKRDKGVRNDAFNASGAGAPYIIDGGDTALDDMIKGVERGLFIQRLAASYPASDGSISGVAKQSFLIEDGKIGRAVLGTTADSNILDMAKNIKAVSKEQVNFGHAIFPYLHIGGVTISG